MALPFASAAAAALPASVSMSARTAHDVPGRTRVAELRFAFDGPADFLPRLIQAAELAERFRKVVSVLALARLIAKLNILVGSLLIEGGGFFGAIGTTIQIPELSENAGLPGDVSEAHKDRERLPVSVLRRFRLSRLRINDAGLMPASRRRYPVRPTA